VVAAESDRQVLKRCAMKPPMALQDGFELGPVEILRLAQHNPTIGRLFAWQQAQPDRFEPAAEQRSALFGLHFAEAVGRYAASPMSTARMK